MKQYERFCKRCGQKIIMTYCDKTGRWVPCDPEVNKYRNGSGPCTFVDTEGNVLRGDRTFSGDPGGEWGYRKHRADCAEVRGKAV